MTKRSKSRREFVEKISTAALSVPFLTSALSSCSNFEKKNLKILILGGTSFLGPHQISYAISRGHSVSIFTRGKTQPTVHKDVFSKVEQLIGDRENDLSELENRSWDVVIDNSGQKSEWTKKTATMLREKAEKYLYISSTGVYFPYLKDNIKENQTVLMDEPKDIEGSVYKLSYRYGVMKAKSEQEVVNAFGKQRSIIVRPTYMFGPGDKTDRFTHWPLRLSRGGEVLVPGKKDDLVQYIDVRDVAEWCIRLIENNSFGTYNAVGPTNRTTMRDFIDVAKKSFDVNHELIYIDDYDFLTENNLFYLVPWIMTDEKHFGSARISNIKAINNGLTFRNLNTSVKELYNWWNSDSITQERRDLLEKNQRSVLLREKEIIEKWKSIRAL